MHVLNSYSFPSLGILEGGYTALSIYEQEYRVKEMVEGIGREDEERMLMPNT